MMKRLIIILSALVVLAAGIATVVIIARTRAARLAAPVPAAEAPASEHPSASAPPATPEKNLQGILPREQDGPRAVSAAAQKDSDGDGLIDGEEVMRGTDPKRSDTDGDGLSDSEEARTYCTNPLKASTDGKTQDKAWVAAREQEATAAGQRPSFCVE